MLEPTLKVVDRLSIWDISHYWHGFNPLKTMPSQLPIEVQKSIRALALKASKNLHLRCATKGLIYKTLTDSENILALSYVRRLYRREFKYAIEGRKYKKNFLTNINMSRNAVLAWCKENKFNPPSFWFAADDPILKKSSEELIRNLTPEEMERFGLITLFIDEHKVSSEFVPSSFHSDLSQERPEFQPKESMIHAAICEINKANAKIRYQPLDKLKQEFKKLYIDNRYKNKSEAARDYFNSLSVENRKIIVRSYYEKDHDKFLENAVRNLRKVLKD